MVRDANADGIVVVVVKVMKSWIFGQDDGELAGEILVDERFGSVWDEDIFLDSFFGFGDESKYFARIKPTVF